MQKPPDLPGPDSGSVAVAVSGGADSLAAIVHYRDKGIPVIALHGIFAQYLDLNYPGRRVPLQSRKTPPGLPEGVHLVEHESLTDPVIDRLSSVCASLDVPLFVADFSDHFLARVIKKFVNSYALGKTPNPCAICNAEIKFGLLLDTARYLGAERLATGHYARLLHREEGPALLQGVDPIKDQSYFLCLVAKNALRSALFPLGDALKATVTCKLERRSIMAPLPIESQEICFVPKNEYRSFLSAAASILGIALPDSGPIVLPDLHRVGTHDGLWQYTEGQRRGLGIAWADPLYVIGKELETNTLLVGTRQDMHCWGCVCDEVNLLVEPELWPEEVLVKTRYRQKAVPAFVQLEKSGKSTRMRITFAQVEQAVAPGQIAAVYISVPGMSEEDGRPLLRLLGGGEITSPI